MYGLRTIQKMNAEARARQGPVDKTVFNIIAERCNPPGEKGDCVYWSEQMFRSEDGQYLFHVEGGIDNAEHWYRVEPAEAERWLRDNFPEE